VAILDANVKRVVTRVQGFEADVAVAANARALWDVASALLPAPSQASQDMAGYTQGMMDLGATVCTPKKPMCAQCPVQDLCAAAKSGDPTRYPIRSRKLKRSSQAIWMLWAQTSGGEVWLARRPTPGVWAGLHCLPLFDSEQALRLALPPDALKLLHCEPAFVHVLTHKDLHLHACRVLVTSTTSLGDGRWVSTGEWPGLGLPAPIRKLLARES
jgi:A/G-specific adenine glycosylase